VDQKFVVTDITSRYDACVELNTQGGSGSDLLKVELDSSNGRTIHFRSGVVFQPSEILSVRHDHSSINQITISGYLLDL